MRLTLRVPVFVLAAAVAAPLAADDLTLVWKVTGKGESPSARTQYLSATKMRNADGERDLVVDLASGTLATIDHKKKEWSETTVAEMDAAMQRMSAQMEGANAKMQEALAKMPPEMREKLGKSMGSMGQTLAPTVTKGGTRKILGYDAQQYTVSMGDTVTMETWNTRDLKLPIQDPGQFRRLAAISLPHMQGMDKIAEEMKKIEGFNLAQTTSFKILGQTRQSASEVTKIDKGPIPASTFDVAALTRGYKKVDSPFTRMGNRPQR